MVKIFIKIFKKIFKFNEDLLSIFMLVIVSLSFFIKLYIIMYLAYLAYLAIKSVILWFINKNFKTNFYLKIGPVMIDSPNTITAQFLWILLHYKPYVHAFNFILLFLKNNKLFYKLLPVLFYNMLLLIIFGYPKIFFTFLFEALLLIEQTQLNKVPFNTVLRTYLGNKFLQTTEIKNKIESKPY